MKNMNVTSGDTGLKKIAEKAESFLQWLAHFGREKDGSVSRLLYTQEWQDAQEALRNKMKEIGLNAYYDGVGNLFGKLEGEDSGKGTVMTGSHIDTVRNGGMYDGAYGIIAGMIAVETLMQIYGRPKYPIEVVSLCEEEGSRFPITFWGSGNITGTKKCLMSKIFTMNRE